MSKTGQWVLGMQEDAQFLSRDSWAAKHGATHLRLYDEVQEGDTAFEPYAVKVEAANRSEEVAATDGDLFNKVIDMIDRTFEDKEARQ